MFAKPCYRGSHIPAPIHSITRNRLAKSVMAISRKVTSSVSAPKTERVMKEFLDQKYKIQGPQICKEEPALTIFIKLSEYLKERNWNDPKAGEFKLMVDVIARSYIENGASLQITDDEGKSAEDLISSCTFNLDKPKKPPNI